MTLVANSCRYYTVTVSASPANGGTVSPSGTNQSGSTITVIATNNPGYVFTGWTSNGVPAVSTTNFTFTLNTNVALVANFLPLYTVTVSASPANGGTVSPSGTNQSGSIITVLATNNAGYVFTGWTSNGVPAVSTTNFTFTLSTNVTLVANFLPLYTVTVSASPASGGTVSPSGTNQSGSIITVLATNNSGYVFTGWTSNDIPAVSTTNFTFTLDTNVTLVANFLPLYTVTVSASPSNGGTVSPSGTNTSGSTVTVIATNNAGYVFTGWTSNGFPAVSTTNFTFTLNTNVTLVANFLPLYTVTVSASPSNGGTASLGGTNESGSVITVIATNNAGYVFTGWTSNGIAAVATTNYTFTLSTNVTLVASFATTPPQMEVFNGPEAVTNGQTNAVDFGSIQLTLPGTVLTFTVTNSGGQTLNLTNITVPAGFALDTNFPATIAAQSNGTFNVEFDSTNIGTNSGNIVITNNDPNNGSYTFAVTGVVEPPSPQIQVLLGLVPIANGQMAPVNFGSVQQSQAGPTLAFTVTNSGGQSLNLTNLSVPSGFTLNPGYPSTIGILGSGTFSVQLDTGTIGSYTGNITLTNNDPTNNPFTFLVSGTVTAQAPQLGVFNGTNVITNGQPTAVSFGSVQQNQMGPAMTFTVTNTGALPLVFTNVTVPAGFTVVTNPPSPIAPGSNGVFSVQLNTAVAGTFSGNISITNNDPTNNPFFFAVTGTVTPVYSVAVSASPSNGGTVSPGGTFAGGAVITVTATNNSGYVFTGWTSNGIPTVSTTNYTFTLGTNVILIAKFLPLYTVTVTASPPIGGTVNTSSTNQSGSIITVVATNNAGYVFTGWTSNGVPTVSTTNYTFTLNTNVTLVANFLPLYTVTVSASPSNAGTVSPSGTNESGSIITVVATNNAGYIFTGWTSNNIPVASTTNYTFTLNTNVTLVANFLPLYTVTVSASPANAGTVSPSGTNQSGSIITVVATNNAGYVFTGWTSNGVPTVSTTNFTFTLSTNVTLVANFLPLYTVTVSASPSNAGTVSPGSTNQSGSTITVVATNNAGYVFTGWTSNNVPVVSTTNFTFTLNTNVTLVANFLPLYTVTVSAAPSNAGTVSPGSTKQSGSTVTVVATNNAGYVFTGWTSNGVPTVSTTNFTFTLSTNVTLVANFLPLYTVTVSASPANGGTVSHGGTNPSGSTITVIATNNSGYVFTGWTSNGIAAVSTPNFTFTLATNVALVANFQAASSQIQVFDGTNAIANGQATPVGFASAEQNQTGSTVTFTVTNSGGQPLDLTGIAVPSGYTLNTNFPATIPAGSNGVFTVQLTATAMGAYEGNISITNNSPGNSPFSFPITGTVTAKIIYLGGNLAFGVVPLDSTAQGSLTISNGGNVPLTVSGITYPHGFSGAFSGSIAAGGSSNVAVTFSPVIPTNYSGALTVNSDATSGSNTISISAFGANTNLLLTIITNGTGSVTPNDAKTFKPKTKLSLKAVPGTLDVFAGWVGSTNSTNNPLVFIMEQDTILQANFIPNPFLPFVGTYNGLFWATNGIVAEQSSGMLKGLALTSKGTYSASLLINGVAKTFTGSFNLAGQASKTVAVGGSEGNVQVVMNLTSNEPAPQVTGTLSGSDWLSTNLVADRATNNSQVAAEYHHVNLRRH